MPHAESIFDDFTDHEADLWPDAAVEHENERPLDEEDLAIRAAMAALGDRQGVRS